MNQREPDFRNLQMVLDKQAPPRPTLFEYYMNEPLYRRLAGVDYRPAGDGYDEQRLVIQGFYHAGYDYATLHASYDFHFPVGERRYEDSMSLNEGGLIADRASFDAIRGRFLDPKACRYDHLERLEEELPAGMKIIVDGPGGVLENVVNLFGFDNLCYLIYDDEQLVYDVFELVGSSLVEYYTQAGRYPSVGAMISNDDWGFKTQTMLSVADMRRFVFPWHREIVHAIHASGRQAILHSCGYYRDIIDDVIEDMGYDARHSYEDAIVPVEEAYEELAGRIAVVGGLDMHFISTASPEEVYERSRAMLERTASRGGYALGTGNSVPEYVPEENYLAMIRAAGIDL